MTLAKFRAAARPAALKVPHAVVIALMTLLSAFAGAAGNYLVAVPMTGWVTGLSDPKSLVPIAMGAAVAGAMALISQLMLLLKQWLAAQVPAVPPPPEVRTIPPVKPVVPPQV
jgi:hypothetical protein